jgi:hypothetical protein
MRYGAPENSKIMCLLEVIYIGNALVKVFRLRLGDTELIWARLHNGTEIDRFDGSSEDCNIWLNEFKRDIVARTMQALL